MKKINLEEVEINGQTYVLKCNQKQIATPIDGKDYVMVRTYSAGVFCGYLEKQNGKEVKLLNARRLWYWDGAASLSQLAIDGTSSPKNCKFPCEVDSIILTEAIEIIQMTEKAKKSIGSVAIWKN